MHVGRSAKAPGPIGIRLRSVAISNADSKHNPSSSRPAAGRPTCGCANALDACWPEAHMPTRWSWPLPVNNPPSRRDGHAGNEGLASAADAPGLGTLSGAAAPVPIGLEACGGAQYWARQWRQHGQQVTRMAPQVVTPDLPSNKPDRRAAATRAAAGTRPPMRLVPSTDGDPQASPARPAGLKAGPGVRHADGLVLPTGGRSAGQPCWSRARRHRPSARPWGRRWLGRWGRSVLLWRSRARPTRQHAQPWPRGLPRAASDAESRAWPAHGNGAVGWGKHGRQYAAWGGGGPQQHSTGGQSYW
jgi:hypothetical protein